MLQHRMVSIRSPCCNSVHEVWARYCDLAERITAVNKFLATKKKRKAASHYTIESFTLMRSIFEITILSVLNVCFRVWPILKQIRPHNTVLFDKIHRNSCNVMHTIPWALGVPPHCHVLPQDHTHHEELVKIKLILHTRLRKSAQF